MVAGREDGLADSSTERPTQGQARGTKKKSNALANFLDALLAVLAGNAIYYLSMPHLPPVARHRLFREDWGLVVDFAICAAIFAAVKYARRSEG
jgi:hypothetical protein